MSEISELIEINRNIEKQNEEIIRLLKKIAGEDEPLYEEAQGNEIPEYEPAQQIDTSLDIGEAFFMESADIFRVSLDDEMAVDNLTGKGTPQNSELAEKVARKSLENAASIDDSTVILIKESEANVPQSLNVCYDQNIKTIYIPLSSMTQLLGAPVQLTDLFDIQYYKSDEDLLEKLFKSG